MSSNIIIKGHVICLEEFNHSCSLGLSLKELSKRYVSGLILYKSDVLLTNFAEHSNERTARGQQERSRKLKLKTVQLIKTNATKVISLYQDGFSVSDIVKQLGLSRGVVNSCLIGIDKEQFKNLRNKLLQEKIKKTNLERYGVENVYQSETIKNKIKKTNLERYGVENVFSLNDNIQKSHTPEVIKRQVKTRASTNLERYGVENVYQSETIKNKIKKTNLERYGVEHAMMNSSVSAKTSKSLIKLSQDTANIDLSSREKFLEQYKIYSNINILAKVSGLSISNIYIQIHRHGLTELLKTQTNPEASISNILDNLIQYKTNTRKIIPPLELDFYIPEKNLAIEVNGLYWHCDKYKDKNYHRNKYEKCLEKNINLISFYDSEINNKFPIVKSMINSRLGLTKRLYARKCQVIPVEQKSEKKLFLEQNHLQGTCGSSVDLGLYHKNELVALMTFGKSRFNKNIKWELIRFCNKLNTTVIGGASKLFKYFTNNYSGDIVSYSNNRYTTGNLYKQLGFELINENKIGFCFTNFKHTFNRVKFQSHKLPNILENYDESRSANDNLSAHRIYRVFDEGVKTHYFKKR